MPGKPRPGSGADDSVIRHDAPPFGMALRFGHESLGERLRDLPRSAIDEIEHRQEALAAGIRFAHHSRQHPGLFLVLEKSLIRFATKMTLRSLNARGFPGVSTTCGITKTAPGKTSNERFPSRRGNRRQSGSQSDTFLRMGFALIDTDGKTYLFRIQFHRMIPGSDSTHST